MAASDERESGPGGVEFERETVSRAADAPGRDRYGDDDYYEYRRRGRASGIGESVRDTARSVRRGGTDVISGSCDLLGSIFIGIGEAISPRRRDGDTSGCAVCATGGRGYYDDDYAYESRPGARVTRTRAEIGRY